MLRHLCASLLMVAGLGPAAAQDCFQDHGLYGEPQAESVLEFRDATDPVDSTLGRFSITFPENGVTFDGVILDAGEPFWRPWGIVMFNCPEGDATGAEIAACTVWEGVIYGLDNAGNVFWLPPLANGEAAADRILLPDFSASVRLSSAWGDGKLSTPPRDDFAYSGCRP